MLPGVRRADKVHVFTGVISQSASTGSPAEQAAVKIEEHDQGANLE
jgi:hypothetical protein